MESEISEKKKEELFSNYLKLLDLLFEKSKDGSKYLGVLKFKSKRKLLFNYISEENNNENKLKFLENFYNILSENPDIVCYYSSFKLGNFCASLYYHFIKLYMSIILSDNRDIEVFQKIKNISLKTIELLLTQVSCPGYYYEYVYEFISSYYLEGNVRMNHHVLLDYLNLLKKLYGEKKNEYNILKIIPKNFIYCQGKQEMLFQPKSIQFNKKSKKPIFSDGMKLMTWFYIKSEKDEEKETQKFDRTVIYFLKSEKMIKVCLNGDLTGLKLFINESGPDTIINLEPRQWYCLELTIISSPKKDNEIKVSVINTTNGKISEIKDTFKEGDDLESYKDFVFYKDFYGFITSIILIKGENKPKEKDNYFQRPFFRWGIYNKTTLNDFNDYVTKNSLLNSVIYLFAPQNYHEKFMNLEDIVFGEKISLMNLKKKPMLKYYKAKHLYKYYKHIQVIGGINAFLPFIDLLFKKKEELLTQEVFESYFDLVTLAITMSKHNLMDACLTNFFGIFGLFLEKMPEEFFTEKIFKSLMQINDSFKNNYEYLKENLKDHPKKKKLLF